MNEAQKLRFQRLEELCTEILDNMEPYGHYYDVVEDIEFTAEYDEDSVDFVLMLEGDLVRAMLRYLQISGDDVDNKNYNKFTVCLDRYCFDKLKSALQDGY